MKIRPKDPVAMTVGVPYKASMPAKNYPYKISGLAGHYALLMGTPPGRLLLKERGSVYQAGHTRDTMSSHGPVLHILEPTKAPQWGDSPRYYFAAQMDMGKTKKEQKAILEEMVKLFKEG